MENFYERTVEDWVKNNENFFGVPAIDYFDEYDKIVEKLDIYCQRFWNSQNSEDWCQLRKALDSKIIGNEILFRIEYNFNCYTVIVDTEFIKNKNIAVIPIVYDSINWEIKGSLYAPRAIAVRNNKYMNKIDNKVFYPNRWMYKIDDDEIITYGENEFKTTDIDDFSVNYLKVFTDFEVGEDIETFKNHLKELPDTKYNYTINYIYTDYKYFFEKILEKVEFYNFSSRVMINCNYIIVANGRIKKYSNDIGALLVLNNENNNHFAISNLRSVMLLTNGYSSSFFFEKCIPFFDCFKVSTNKNAGKLRLILDDVEIRDGMLWKTINGKQYNQFEIYKKYYVDGDEKVITDTLSDISKSPYCFNNGPKRIMMTGKAYGQSISVVGENDKETHAIQTRVVFGDFFGYTIGDGLVCSESFAKRLLHKNKEVIFITTRFKEVLDKYWNFKKNEPTGEYVTLEDFVTLKQKFVNKYLRFENIKITNIQKIKSSYQVTFFYEITLQVGDKLTNLHGAKGVIGLILKDEDMPYLIKDFGDMKAGPIELIVSSFGVNDRKNVGQILEAYDNCNCKKSCKNLIGYKGKVYDKAFGMIQILRLYHTNIYHASFSKIESSFDEMINLGEMERNCLLIQDLPELLQEIDLRSNRNYKNKISEVILGNNHDEDTDKGMFLNVLNSLGYEFEVVEEE